MDGAKSLYESELVPINVCRHLRRGQDRAWKSMEELPIRSLLTNKLRERWAQSEFLHASSASSSPASSAVVLVLSSSLISTPSKTVTETGPAILMKDVETQVTCMHILDALKEATQCEEHASLMKDTQLEEASSCISSPSERGNDAEHGCGLENTKRQETSARNVALPRSTDTEHSIRQKDEESQDTSTCTLTLLERATDAEDMSVLKGAHLQESSTHIANLEQAVVIKVESQEMSTHVCIPSEREEFPEHTLQENGVEMQETFSHILSPSKRTEDNAEQAIMQMKGTISQEMATQMFTTIKETDGMEHTADDIEHASQIRNMSSQEMSTSTSSERTSEACTLRQKNVELQETSTHSTMIELSLHQHLQQDDVTKEEVAMRSFIMHRFLPAAKEVAAEHESSIASLGSKNHSEATSPSLPDQSQRTPIAHRIKSRAQRAPKGFTSSRPLHSRHQEDDMPHSMRSCGFFCLGLKTALFRAHRTVSASARSTLRKKSWAPHSSNQMKVADERTSLISSEMEGLVAPKKEAMGGVTKHQSAMNIYTPVLHPLSSPKSVNFQESLWKHAVKYHDSFSRRGCSSSDGCTSVGCNPPLSQSGEANLAGNQFEKMKSMQSSHDDHVRARNFGSTAIKEQDNETVQEGVAPCNQKRACDCKSTSFCHHVENLSPHDLAGENMMSSRDVIGGLETSGSKPANEYAFRSAWHDGDDEEDEEPQFFDALSRLNSVKSNATFYTFGSPRSECEVLGFQGEWINDEVGFTDASSHFETPRGSTSENKSVLSHVCAANEKGMSQKMSSLSKRVGKGLKLETESKQAKSPSKHDPCAYEQQTKLRTESFSRLWHPSLDSMSGLYPSKASAITPVFPAKCQNNTPNALGWPFGISSYQLSGAAGSPHHTQQEKSIEKYVVGGNVPSPPLPPSPAESWLGKAVTKNASKTSPLATLQQKEKVASARKKLDFISANPDAERRWEDVVKGSQVHLGHLRFSEELHQHHPSNLNPIKPLKL